MFISILLFLGIISHRKEEDTRDIVWELKKDKYLMRLSVGAGIHKLSNEEHIERKEVVLIINFYFFLVLYFLFSFYLGVPDH